MPSPRSDEDKAREVVSCMEHGPIVLKGRANFIFKQPPVYEDELKRMLATFNEGYTASATGFAINRHCRIFGVRFDCYDRPRHQGFQGELYCRTSVCRNCGSHYDTDHLNDY